jgi:hypothetical protein
MNKMKQQLDTIDVEAKLKAFIRYLVTNFPQCGLLSRQIGERIMCSLSSPMAAVPERPSRSSGVC